jgi:hypothetical protein
VTRPGPTSSGTGYTALFRSKRRSRVSSTGRSRYPEEAQQGCHSNSKSAWETLRYMCTNTHTETHFESLQFSTTVYRWTIFQHCGSKRRSAFSRIGYRYCIYCLSTVVFFNNKPWDHGVLQNTTRPLTKIRQTFCIFAVEFPERSEFTG